MRRKPAPLPALLSALQFHGAHPEALEALDDSACHELRECCGLAHLPLPLWRDCADVFPGWVRERLERNASDNARRFDNIKRVYLELAKALEDVQVEYLVIKGFAQFPGYVEDPRLRMQSDIDIYCPPESILRATDALLR